MNAAQRARRAAAIAGWAGDEATARAAFGHPEPAVRSSALGALARMDALCEADLVAGLTDPAPQVRRRACDLAGRLGRPPAEPGRPGGLPPAPGGPPWPVGLITALVGALADRAPSVVEAACYALGELASLRTVADVEGAVGALVGTARWHEEPLCREAAVAALGAIGDPRGLPAILVALDDKAAVRRRAVVALAAFEGPEAETGLAKAARDRDWQARQLAEDLLFSS